MLPPTLAISISCLRSCTRWGRQLVYSACTMGRSRMLPSSSTTWWWMYAYSLDIKRKIKSRYRCIMVYHSITDLIHNFLLPWSMPLDSDFLAGHASLWDWVAVPILWLCTWTGGVPHRRHPQRDPGSHTSGLRRPCKPHWTHWWPPHCNRETWHYTMVMEIH